MTTLDAEMTWDEGLALLKEHNKDPFHIEHGDTVGKVMRSFAEEYDPENVDFWGVVGLLHDVDWEEYPTVEEHTIKGAEILKAAGGTDVLVHAVQTHNSDANAACPKPRTQMEKLLFATDELSGLIGAAVAMRPSHSVMDFNVKSLKKKFKTKGFAAGCSRDVIASGAEMLGWDLDVLFDRVIKSMQSFAPDKDTFQPPE